MFTLERERSMAIILSFVGTNRDEELLLRRVWDAVRRSTLTLPPVPTPSGKLNIRDLDVVREAGFLVGEDGQVLDDSFRPITEFTARLMELISDRCYHNGRYAPTERTPCQPSTLD